MPLRDHFHPPLSERRSWEELHGAWPGTIAFRLNALLPPEYYSGVHIHLGAAIEIDVAAFESPGPVAPPPHDPETLWQAAAPATLLETEELTPPEYEVRVYDEQQARRLVAVELVSPRNKDRAESRTAFVAKCQALLQQEVCVVIVDPVTNRLANLYGELADRLGADPPTLATASIYAVACRAFFVKNRWKIEAWEHRLAVGTPLPTLPLWLSQQLYVPLELEATYEDTCRGLRMP